MPSKSGSRAASLPGIIDITPGIRSLQIHYDGRRARRAFCSTRWTLAKNRFRISTTSRCRRASCICRCPGTIRPRSWRSPNTCSRCGPTRPGARATSSSSAASTASTRSTTCTASSSTRATWCSGPGRRLSGRAGRDAARSAPPPGHHQVQSGAHLDAGKRGRHRRRLSVRLRHGRARRLSVRRAARCRCGTRSTPRPSFSPARRGCCASSIRSASFR